MPLIVQEGDLFAPENTVIAHGCNTQGFMGAGVAKVVRDKYPSVYDTYAQACRRHQFVGGDALPVVDQGRLVYNLGTQIQPGPYATVNHVILSMYSMFVDMRQRGVSQVAIPALGCGIGGLHWEQLLRVLGAIVPEDIQVTVVVVPGEFPVPVARGEGR